MIAAIHNNLVFAVYNPGQGQAPPGSGSITTIIQWAAWLVFAAAVAAVMLAGGRMMWARQTGGMTSDHTSSLVWTLGGVIVAGFAAAIVTAIA